MSYKITTSKVPIAAVLASQDEIIFNYPAAKIWNPDGVSLARRIKNKELSSGEIDKLLASSNLQRYIVPADMRAPTRCIDGRITKNWSPTKNKSITLGPKIAGGTAHAALAHRIVDVETMTDRLIFEEDIKQVIRAYKKIGIGFGGHIDDNQTGSNTGCGAVDNINRILERLQVPEPQEQLRGLAKFILGNAYDQTITNEVIGRMLYLDAVKPRYMPKENDNPQGEFLYKRSVVETIRQEAARTEEPVPALTGSHNEVAAVLNFVPDTTIDTDRFSFDTKNKVQIFGWDIWEMYEEARYLYTYNMYESVEMQRQAVENRLKHITTRALLGLATTMVLTDGSLKLVIVRSN